MMKGILKGIVIVLLVGIIFALLGCQGTYFNDASIRLGLDHTKNISPMCVPYTLDDRSTSNVGFGMNIYRFNNFEANTTYTHHSCAFGIDVDSYDAVGIEFKYKFWERKP